jgi:3'(2'), 5'-bisphosphate nucleotidase
VKRRARSAYDNAFERSTLLEALLPIARAAGQAIMRIYAAPFVVRKKDDASPVTDADVVAEAVILEALAQLTPEVPVVAEEQMSAGLKPVVARSFWLIDPLDGTREFIKRNGEFTVNIALIQDQLPVLGVLFAPAVDRLFAGYCSASEDGNNDLAHASVARPRGFAFQEQAGLRTNIACRTVPANNLIVACSRSHGREDDLNDYLRPWPVGERVRIGSSLKFGLLAAGEADLYPRLSPTMEWDTAAGHAIVRAAGGAVTDLHGAELRYGKPEFRNGNFVAWGHRQEYQ